MKDNMSLSENRIDWVDYAKGICIIAVVAMYTTVYVEEILQKHSWMHYFVDFAQPFRMPDFFLISGLFLSRVIDRPWRSYLDTKVLHFFYFYALWVTIKFILIDGRGLFDPERHHMLIDYFSVYVQPHGPLWFIYILPLFFVVARLVRSIPVTLVIAAAILLKLVDFDTGWKLVDRFGIYFIFFYTGHVFASQIFRMVAWARANKKLSLLVLALWFTVNWLLGAQGLTFHPAVHLLTGYAGAVAIILLSALLADLPWMGWLRYLGEHSIVVYLAFVVPLALMRRLITVSPLIIDVGTVAMLVIILSIVGALAIYWMVRNTPLRFLFERPAWVSIPFWTGTLATACVHFSSSRAWYRRNRDRIAQGE